MVAQMFNMIRGDFYRLKHSKGFYITEFILIILIILVTANGALGSIGARSDALESFQNFQKNGDVWTAVNATKLMTSMASALIYLILPLFIMTSGFEFSRHSYKNLLSSGMTRLNYFFSKYAVFVVLMLLQFILYYGSVYVFTGFKNGFGVFTVHYAVRLGQTILFQLLLMIAAFSVAILALYVTFSTIAAVVTAIIFPLFISIIRMIFNKVDWLKYFDFQGTIDSAYFTHLSSHNLGLYIHSFICQLYKI